RHRDLPRLIRNTGRVHREQLRLRRHRHLDQVLALKPLLCSRRLWFAAAAISLFACSRSRTPEPPASTAPVWLVERARQEAEAAGRSQVLHDFRFTDRRAASGITFENRSVDDAGRAYKHGHYDHGTGLCAADVDGDGLPDLFFVTQLGTSELWKNLGDGRFANITDAAGLSMPDAIAVGCSFADIDNDGDPDLFVTTVRHGNRLFENLGGGKVRDITAQAGAGNARHSSGTVFFVYDGARPLDLFCTSVCESLSKQTGPGSQSVE